jgi:hypothetical protein
VKRMLIRSNGLKLEVFEISQPLMIFTADPKNRYPLPIVDEVMSENIAREMVRDLIREPRYKRKL